MKISEIPNLYQEPTLAIIYTDILSGLDTTQNIYPHMRERGYDQRTIKRHLNNLIAVDAVRSKGFPEGHLYLKQNSDKCTNQI